MLRQRIPLLLSVLLFADSAVGQTAAQRRQADALLKQAKELRAGAKQQQDAAAAQEKSLGPPHTQYYRVMQPNVMALNMTAEAMKRQARAIEVAAAKLNGSYSALESAAKQMRAQVTGLREAAKALMTQSRTYQQMAQTATGSRRAGIRNAAASFRQNSEGLHSQATELEIAADRLLGESFKSRNTNAAAVPAIFENRSGHSVRVEWLQTDGKPKYYTTIQPEKEYSITTGVEHLWQFSANGRVLGYHRVTPEQHQRFIVGLTRFVPFSNARWMHSYRHHLGPKRLRDVVLPGTHDSGTYHLDSTWLRKTNFGNAFQIFSPDSDDLKRALSHVPGVFTGWARAHERNAFEQLRDGVRYLDLRVAVDGFGKLVTCHGVYAAPIDEILKDVNRFLDKNAGEIVVLSFNHFYDGQYQKQKGLKLGSQGMRPEVLDRLVSMIKRRLRGKLISSRFTPNSTLDEIWKDRTKTRRNQVIADFTHNHVQADPLIWSNKVEAGAAWVGSVVDRDKFFKETAKKVSSTTFKNAIRNKMFEVKLAVTPTNDLIGKSLDPTGTYPKTLGALADQTNPSTMYFLRHFWGGRPINVVTADFYNRSDLVRICQHLNGIPVSMRNLKIKPATQWGNWHLGVELAGRDLESAGKKIVNFFEGLVK